MKKIHIIGTVGVPACYGGFETLVDNLLGSEDQDITVYCSGKNYPKAMRQDTYKSAKLVYIPLKANGLHSVFYDIFSLLLAIFKKADVILILGVSGCLFLPLIKLSSHSKIITNIDGLEWRRDKWNKYVKWFLKISEKFAVKYSDVIIADNQAIADYVTNEYNIHSQVIAYGGDHTRANVTKSVNGGYALSLCRIEPENNVDLILSAFSKTKTPLKFVGNWDNSDYGRNLKANYSSFENIEILDPIYDLNTLANLRSNCSYYVHGHSAGGTNPSLVEMMHFGKTILCYDCAYNRASTDNKAAFFTDVTQLLKMINAEKVVDNGSEMLNIAKSRYTWEVIKAKYFQLFV